MLEFVIKVKVERMINSGTFVFIIRKRGRIIIAKIGREVILKCQNIERGDNN